MASSLCLYFLLSLSILVAGAAARPGIHFHPCKTLFISYTFTSSETFDLPQIAATRDPSSLSSGSYFAVYRTLRPVRPLPFSSSSALPVARFRPTIVERPRAGAAADVVPAELSFGISSLQERAKDVLFVVAGLLFGVGCGALTGSLMYLAWSLFTNWNEICRSSDTETEDEDESPKKMGYIKIADPVSAKEGHEGH